MQFPIINVPTGATGPPGSTVVLAGAQHGLLYPPEQTERLFCSGEVMRFNSQLTDGRPYLSYDSSKASLLIAHPGKYVITCTLYISGIAGGEHTEIKLVLNGQVVASHDVIAQQGMPLPLILTNIIEVTAPYTSLTLLNSGHDLILHPLARYAATLGFWGLI